MKTIEVYIAIVAGPDKEVVRDAKFGTNSRQQALEIADRWIGDEDLTVEGIRAQISIWENRQ